MSRPWRTGYVWTTPTCWIAHYFMCGLALIPDYHCLEMLFWAWNMNSIPAAVSWYSRNIDGSISVSTRSRLDQNLELGREPAAFTGPNSEASLRHRISHFYSDCKKQWCTIGKLSINLMIFEYRGTLVVKVCQWIFAGNEM